MPQGRSGDNAPLRLRCGPRRGLPARHVRERLDPTHVDGELRGSVSDIVVEVPRRNPRGVDGQATAAIFIFAVEHQSKDERFIVFRQLGDCVRIWERWLGDDPGATHLPPIVPVVVHNGDRPWHSPTRLDALFDLPEVPRTVLTQPILPSFEIVLADLAGPVFTREAIRAAGAESVTETLVENLQAATRPEAEALFDDWVARLEPLRDEPVGGSTIAAALWFLLNVSAVPDPRIVAASAALPEPVKASFMTGAEQRIQRGLERGRQEGRQEGERAALVFIVLRQARLRFGAVPPDGRASRPPADSEHPRQDQPGHRAGGGEEAPHEGGGAREARRVGGRQRGQGRALGQGGLNVREHGGVLDGEKLGTGGGARHGNDL
ncbi:Rpn family recombination-promoting nuclease/putative transposase [Myxococcota bacterium]|nr:Rpn family recombination-promoting nuclease/putative transposase [Myxococcota bacterium]